MASTPGVDIVYDRGAHVLDVGFPVIRKEYWERALNQAQESKHISAGQGQGTTATLRAHERGTSVP